MKNVFILLWATILCCVIHVYYNEDSQITISCEQLSETESELQQEDKQEKEQQQSPPPAPQEQQQQQQFKVGLIVSNASKVDENLERVFNWTIRRLNNGRHRSGHQNKVKLVGSVERFTEGDAFSAETATCRLLAGGAGAIIGPADGYCSTHVASICDSLGIIHFNIQPPEFDFALKESSKLDQLDGTSSSLILSKYASIDLSISRRILYEAYLDLIIDTLKWEKLIYIYDNDDHLFHFKEAILRRSSSGADKLKFLIIKINFYRSLESSQRKLFRALRTRRLTLVLLDIECNHVLRSLRNAQQVNMMTEANAYVILCPDLQHLKLDDFQYSDAILVWMNPITKLMGPDGQQEARSMIKQAIRVGDENLMPQRIAVKDANVHDSLICLAQTLNHSAYLELFKLYDSSHQVVSDYFTVFSSNQTAETKASEMQQINYIEWCNQKATARRSNVNNASAIKSYIRNQVDYEGFTGRIQFDLKGERSELELNILRLTELGPEIIGNWSLGTHKIQLKEPDIMLFRRAGKSLFEIQDKFKIVSILSKPFFMLKQSKNPSQLLGNARYEGYIVDLISEIAQVVGFEFELIHERSDQGFGEIDNNTMQWNGTLNQLISGQIDLAVGDLTITSSREDVVDFTLPYMKTGVSILYKRPTKKELEYLSFLMPFEWQVWCYVVGAYVGVSSIMYVIGQLSPYEWVPCEQCDYMRQSKSNAAPNPPVIKCNQHSLANSFWFTISALMQQGCDIAPRSIGVRIIASNWYFFTLIIISTYTANLASFISIEQIIYPFENVEDLYKINQRNGDDYIRYGCLRWGSTRNFFMNSTNSLYKKMFERMELINTIDEGKELVAKGNYAMFTEAMLIKYIVQRNCTFTQIGGLLNTRGYGIAMSRNSSLTAKYRSQINEAILSLQEDGTMYGFKERWWRDKGGGMVCDSRSKQREQFKEFTMNNLGGVFLILIIGILIGFILCAMELYCKCQRVARAKNTTKWAQLRQRIIFALKMD